MGRKWKWAQPWWGSNPRSLDFIPSFITRHASDRQIYFYISGSPKKEIAYENDKKNMNLICPMMAILNFTICGKTVSFTAWQTAEMDSAQNFHIGTTNEVLFPKNAYRFFSRAIFQFLSYHFQFTISHWFISLRSVLCLSCINKSFVIKWVSFSPAQNCYELPSSWSGVSSFLVKTLNCHISRIRHTRISVFGLNWESNHIHSIHQKSRDFIHGNLAYLALICAVWSSRCPTVNLSAAPVICMVAFQRVGGSRGWLHLNSVQIRHFSNHAVKQTGRN